jgi:hypothetical protein
MKISDFIVLIMSIGAIVYGCVGRDFYYAKSIAFWSASDKRMPAWQGRVMFIGIGVLLLVPELFHLFSN